jgi:hypothetical protein
VIDPRCRLDRFEFQPGGHAAMASHDGVGHQRDAGANVEPKPSGQYCSASC